jgi:CBS domain-containing protein
MPEDRTVRDVMTPNPITVPTPATAWDAARLMKEQGIGDVLVVEGDRLAGIVTDRDLVVRVMVATPVGEIASDEIKSVSPDDPVDHAVGLMREAALRRLPVTQNGYVVGVVSIGDLAVEREPGSALADISAAPPNQ